MFLAPKEHGSESRVRIQGRGRWGKCQFLKVEGLQLFLFQTTPAESPPPWRRVVRNSSVHVASGAEHAVEAAGSVRVCVCVYAARGTLPALTFS